MCLGEVTALSGVSGHIQMKRPDEIFEGTDNREVCPSGVPNQRA